MRARASVISQFLTAFAVVAVVIGLAALVGYRGVTREQAAARQLTGVDQLLQQRAGLLQVEFDLAQSVVNGYALSGRRSLLLPLPAAERTYLGDGALLRKTAPRYLQGYLSQQQRTGARLFGIAAQMERLPPRSAATQRLAATLPAVATRFYQANYQFQERAGEHFGQATSQGSHALSVGLAWSTAALAAAILLVLGASLSTLQSITKPLRALTATVRRLTAGDQAARAPVTGAAEVREVARSINAQADEAARLRAQETEHSRLRGMAREAGLRIREHLAADDVLREAQIAVQQNLAADMVYLRLVENGRLAGRVGPDLAQTLAADEAVRRSDQHTLDGLHELFRAQKSLVINDMQGADGRKLAALYSPELLELARVSGVGSLLITPFGVGADLLGTIVAERRGPGRAWTTAEVDAVESIGADLGRGLNHARLYEAENRLVADLKALDAAKSDFFATVSHELRSPLTTIEGYLEMLCDQDADPVTPRQRTMITNIDRSATRLHQLVEDVFTLATLESSAFSPPMRPVHVAEVVTSAVDAVRPAATAGKLTLACSGLTADLVVPGDSGELERLLINLLSNAVKFTPELGEIDVTTAADHGSAVIRVKDTGIGIPARDQQELFTRFYRASNATARRIPGTGLGLTIVRTIVTRHGGDLSLESAEDAGTTVTVRLPLLVSAAS